MFTAKSAIRSISEVIFNDAMILRRSVANGCSFAISHTANSLISWSRLSIAVSSSMTLKANSTSCVLKAVKAFSNADTVSLVHLIHFVLQFLPSSCQSFSLRSLKSPLHLNQLRLGVIANRTAKCSICLNFCVLCRN